MHPDYTGRGLASTVVRLLTDAAFSVAAIASVEVHTDKANLASAAVPRRLGFRFVGETPDEASAPAEVGSPSGLTPYRLVDQSTKATACALFAS